ncbi:hypothetical protein EDD18DRAFT_1366909 [Armillaria luteobubalina]|uniref:F-box domain-containing protein n=1 Tax=Armillaria luteobubalina TaxID=153913 RepID=A0AA39P177_9AGAR|nr:hypothetical protein EDD18DRAFT_1366909 [Armillaria luteobubalina]
MSSQPNLATFEHNLHSELEHLPLELFENIVSYLDIPTIKTLSRVSSVFREACIPLFFRNLVLSGDSSLRSTEILGKFKERTLVPSLRKVELRDLRVDLSQALLAWCTRVHTIKIEKCLVGNTSILPSMIVLYDLELSDLTFQSAEGYFRLLASLPLTLKKLAVLRNTFLESRLYSYAIGRGIEVEHFQAESAEDLSLLLRDDCPMSLKSLQVANVSRISPHDLERLVEKTPRLLHLKIEIKKQEDRPVSYPLTRLKTLSIIDRYQPSDTLIQLFSTPNIASPLEVVNFAMIIFGWEDALRRLVVTFSRPRFCKLKQVNVTILQPSDLNMRHRINPALLNDYACLAERGLGTAGRSPRTQVTLNVERRLAFKSDDSRLILCTWDR